MPKKTFIVTFCHTHYVYLHIPSFFSDALQQGASQFEQQAGKLKSKFWLQNLKVILLSFNIFFYFDLL